MKNQPNKATVKDGLPTAEQFLRTKGFYETKGVVNIHDEWHDIAVMLQEYSDQQNAELRERVKELEATRKSECIAFANWLSNQVLRGRSIEKLWRDYEMEVLK